MYYQIKSNQFNCISFVYKSLTHSDSVATIVRITKNRKVSLLNILWRNSPTHAERGNPGFKTKDDDDDDDDDVGDGGSGGGGGGGCGGDDGLVNLHAGQEPKCIDKALYSKLLSVCHSLGGRTAA